MLSKKARKIPTVLGRVNDVQKFWHISIPFMMYIRRYWCATFFRNCLGINKQTRVNFDDFIRSLLHKTIWLTINGNSSNFPTVFLKRKRSAILLTRIMFDMFDEHKLILTRFRYLQNIDFRKITVFLSFQLVITIIRISWTNSI